MKAYNLALVALVSATLAAASSATANPSSVAAPGPGVTAFSLDRTDASPVAAATRLVVFRYSDQVSFTIRSMPSAFTNIELPEGEAVQGFYLSDPTSWSFHVTEDRRRVLLKPAAVGAYATGTLVTDRRSYELTMIAVGHGEPWFQRVRWDVATSGSAATGIFSASPEVDDSSSPISNTSPEKLNFRYTVKGRADFAPVVVFDDGIRTWFKLGASQDMPAIFAITNREIDVVEVARRGDYAVVPRLSSEWLLKLHGKEVKVRRAR
ncbi:MAG: hypothetical protein DDT25_00078 [Chloroflexi bacterium]|nr:hypothetical protein [Chloroflexota bacterium]